MKLFTIALILLANIANAGEIKINLYERDTKETTTFAFNTESSALQKIKTVDGTEIPKTNRYVIRNYKLTIDDKPITRAINILYQCQIEDADLLIIRDEFNSISNPFRLLAFVAGHPTQVSKIKVLVVKNGILKSEKEIASKASSYDWEAKAFR